MRMIFDLKCFSVKCTRSSNFICSKCWFLETLYKQSLQLINHLVHYYIIELPWKYLCSYLLSEISYEDFGPFLQMFVCGGKKSWKYHDTLWQRWFTVVTFNNLLMWTFLSKVASFVLFVFFPPQIHTGRTTSQLSKHTTNLRSRPHSVSVETM